MSDDGHLMLYATFNDTLVEEQRFPWFGTKDESNVYPEIRSLRYPKVNIFSLFALILRKSKFKYVTSNEIQISNKYRHDAWMLMILIAIKF